VLSFAWLVRAAALAITKTAFDAIASTMALGSVGFVNATNEKGERLIWLERAAVAYSATSEDPVRATVMSSCGWRWRSVNGQSG
jgi:hypothetical protein